MNIRKRPDNPHVAKIWDRLDSLNPLDFLTLTGFGSDPEYCINIDEASILLNNLGWNEYSSVEDGISLLQEYFRK